MHTIVLHVVYQSPLVPLPFTNDVIISADDGDNGTVVNLLMLLPMLMMMMMTTGDGLRVDPVS